MQTETSTATADRILPKNKSTKYGRTSNIDMFHSDSFRDWEDEETSHERSNKSRPQSKKHRNARTGGSRWTYRMRSDLDEEWDWDELHSTYVNDDGTDEDNDLHDEYEEMRGHRASRQKRTKPTIPPPSKECSGHLRILGLPDNVLASAKDLKEAFYKCALRWHPDRHDKEQKAQAESKFKQVQEAYKALQAHVMA